MPELPEVETIRLGLEKVLIGQQITGVDTVWLKSFVARPTDIKKLVVGHKIKGLRRRGKVLIIDLDNDYSLLIHLKMTGQLVYDEQQPAKSNKAQAGNRFAGGHPTKSMVGDLPDNSTRVIFKLKAGGRLFFNDQRKFGWIKLVPKAEVDLDSLIAKLGPEPLEAAFIFEDFYQQVSKRKAPIKPVILDQTVLAGVGNIYADEALHLAKIHPLTPANTLTKLGVKKLYEAIKTVLGASIGYGGTSFTNYVNALGLKGNYLDYARVFKRQGKACPICSTKIVKIRVGGRGTHFCPVCQRL